MNIFGNTTIKIINQKYVPILKTCKINVEKPIKATKPPIKRAVTKKTSDVCHENQVLEHTPCYLKRNDYYLKEKLNKSSFNENYEEWEMYLIYINYTDIIVKSAFLCTF